jgi:hypothetical protein
MPELIARVLAGRGVAVDEAVEFLDPTLRNLMPDPYTLTDCEKAAKRIADAIDRGEQVAIFGDYDVDGASLGALLTASSPISASRRDLYSRPHLRRLRPQPGGDRPADRQRRATDRHRRLRLHQP